MQIVRDLVMILFFSDNPTRGNKAKTKYGAQEPGTGKGNHAGRAVCSGCILFTNVSAQSDLEFIYQEARGNYLI